MSQPKRFADKQCFVTGTPPTYKKFISCLAVRWINTSLPACLPLFIHHCLCVPACPQESSPVSGLKDQQVLGVWGYCQLFQHSVDALRSQLGDKGEEVELMWDKVTQTDGGNVHT